MTKKILRLCAVALIFLILFTGDLVFTEIQNHSKIAYAQSSSWGGPINVSNSNTESGPPALTIDPSGKAHLIWVEENLNSDNSLMYSYWLDDFWTTPNDIVIDNYLDTFSVPNLISDSRGYLHISFWANGIAYSNAFAPEAVSASAWKQVEVLVPYANLMTIPHMALGPNDSLHIIYGVKLGSYSGIYYIQSIDYGDTWSQPQPVYINPLANKLVDQPKIAVDSRGKVHVIWVEANYPDTFPPAGIRYSSSIDSNNWSEPLSLGDGPYQDAALLTKDDQEIHIVWNGTSEDRFKFHRYSKDAGRSWLPYWRNQEVGGLQGRPALVMDSMGRLYWLQVGSAYNIDGADWLYENIYNNGIWNPGLEIFDDEVPEQNMSNVSAQVGLGNVIHLAVWAPVPKSDGGYQGDVFYFTKNLDSPTLPAQTLNKPAAIPTLSQVATKFPTSAPTQIVLSPGPVDSNPEPWNTAIVIGLAPAGLLITLVIIFRVIKSNQRS
jgi:hypothetical protein